MNRSIFFLLIHLFTFSMIKSQDIIVDNHNFQNTIPEAELKSPVDSTQQDKKKVQTHGVYLEILGKSIYYNLGYEFISKTNKNGIGFSTDISYHFESIPSGVRFSNLYLGCGFIYEWGDHWGIRTGLNIGARIIPEMYGDKFSDNNVLPVDQPYYHLLTPSFEIGPFYRSKNYKWQITPKFDIMYLIYRYKGFDGDYFYEEPKLWLGLAIKYNFSLNTLGL